jgi:small GTP-binding protein
MIKKKVCMLGSFAVGKTSLVRRFVHSVFRDEYLTTIGVKVDKKKLEVDGQPVELLLWDIHGEDQFQKVRANYLLGAAGYFLVVDGTRPDTIETAEKLNQLAVQTVGSKPHLLLLNKADLEDQWDLTHRQEGELEFGGWRPRRVSAKTGLGVEDAFEELARLMLPR